MSSAVVTHSMTMRGHTDRVRGVVHLSDGQRIVTCSTDGSLRLWDLKSGAQIGKDWQDEGSSAGILSMALSPTGMTIASTSRDGTVALWDIEKRMATAKWKGHTKAARSVCWSPDGERVVSGGWDGTAKVWDVKSGCGKPVLGLNPIETRQESVLAVSYAPKGTKIATEGVTYSGIKIWDAKIGKLLHTIDTLYHAVWSLAWTLDEKKLISGLSNGSIDIFNTATMQLINQDAPRHHNQLVRTISISRNGRLLVSTSSDGTARLWNLATSSQVGPPLRHKNDVKCAAISANGKLLSTGCDDENAYMWDIQAILEKAGLEDLLTIPVPEAEPKQTSSSSSSIEHISPSNIRKNHISV